MRLQVDVPGHTLSFCASHPEVCPTPSCGSQNALAPHTNATFELIEKIFADVADATTDRVLHVGGDEVQYRSAPPPPRAESFCTPRGHFLVP